MSTAGSCASSGLARPSGDAWVLFPAIQFLHAGDMFAGKNAPLIDTMSGGSAVEYGKTLMKAYNGIRGYDTIITGHSPLMKPADLKEYADANNDFITWVQSEMKAGKTVDQAAADWKTPAKFPAYGPPAPLFGGIKGNIQTAYDELKK